MEEESNGTDIFNEASMNESGETPLTDPSEQIKLLQNQIEALYSLVKSQDEKVRSQDKKLAELQVTREEEVAGLQKQLTEQQILQEKKIAELEASQGFLRSHLQRVLPEANESNFDAKPLLNHCELEEWTASESPRGLQNISSEHAYLAKTSSLPTSQYDDGFGELQFEKDAIDDTETRPSQAYGTESLEIPQTTYSFLMFLKIRKKSTLGAALIGLSVFAIQMLAYILMIYNSMDRNQSFNPFDFPPNVPVSTRFAEFLALIIIVASDDDAIKAVLMWYDGFSGNLYEGALSRYASLANWRLSVYTRGVQGFANILAAFILVMQSLTVVDLLLNFTALQFLSHLDDTVFYLSVQGFLGKPNKKIADEINESTYRIRARNRVRENLPKILIVAFYVPLLIGYFYISTLQFRGQYSCQTVFIQFDDAVQFLLPGLSGHYKYHNDGDNIVYKLDIEEEIGVAQLQFCATEEMWTLTLGPNENHCNDWIVRSSSSRTYEFDITAAINSEWIVRNFENKEIVMENFRMFCADCSVVNFCGPEGTCDPHLDRCICAEGWYGLRCDFPEPCSAIEIGTPNRNFPGFRQWSRTYTRMVSASGNSSFVRVYEHPVYYGQTSSGIIDLIFFTGKRWIVTSSVMLNDLVGEVTKESLVTYLENDFHSYWSNFSFLLVSDRVEIDSSSDTVSPDGLLWFQYDENVDVLQSIEVTLLCIVCNNSTNPCLNEGVCTTNNRCDCSINGASGALCQLAPVQNGFCDKVFNTPYFDFDGGDCCQASCTSDEFICGWNKDNTKYISYCDCADLDHICPEGVNTCWLEIGDSVVGEIEYAESGRSLAVSNDGTILAVGEPGDDQVRLFDSDGSTWNQLGEALEGEQGSGFGSSVALSGDGRVLAVGSPDFDIPNLRIDANPFAPVMQGQISIFTMTDYVWHKVDEIAIDALGKLVSGRLASASLDGRLGSSLALSQDGRLVVFGIERTGLVKGGVFGFERDETTGAYFQSEVFLLDDAFLWDDCYTYWTRSISVSKSAHMVVFDAIEEGGTSEVFVAKYALDENNEEYRLLGTPIQGCCGILSGNGLAVVVSSEEDSPTCQVYSWDDSESDWVERGEVLSGTASALSSDGLTLAVARNDSTIHTWFWDGSQWSHQGHIMGGSEVAVVLSGGYGGVDTSMAVGLPSDSSAGRVRGKTVVHKLHHSGQNSTASCRSRNSIIDIGLFTDNRPNETIWEIRDFFTQEILLQGGPYDQDSQRGQFVSDSIQMPINTACAEFTIYDLAGDGICCENGFGSYTLSFGNLVEKIGGHFGWSDRHLFGTSCRRTCEEEDSLLSVEISTDFYGNETTWILSEQSEGIVLRGGPYEAGVNKYAQETCIASSGCFNLTVFDSYGDGMCCANGVGGYAVRVDGDVIGRGDIFEFSQSFEFGQCSSNTSAALSSEGYLSVLIESSSNTLPFKKEWFLYEIGSEIVIRGNESMHLNLDKNLCYLFEGFQYEGNGRSKLAGYSLFVDDVLVLSSDSFFSGDFRMVGSCGHVATTFSVPHGNSITCIDDSSNFCVAPKSCANAGINLEPTGKNVFGIGLRDGVWTTSGAYSLTFERDCNVVCSGACNTAIPVSFSCGDDEVLMRLQISSGFDLGWNIGNHDGETLYEGSLSESSHTVISERICIAAHVCTILTIEGEGDYILYVDGEYFVSGSTSGDYAVENVCPNLARATNTISALDSKDTYSSFSRPSNDWCGNGTPLVIGSDAVKGSTENATVDAVVRCGETSGSVSAGVWYHVIGTGKELVADLCGSDYDTQVSVFVGSCDSLSCVAGNDNFCGEEGKQSRVAWDSVDGTEYFVLVHGAVVNNGSYVLEVNEVTLPRNDNCSGAIALSLNNSHVSASGFTDISTIDHIPTCYQENEERANSTKIGVWFSVKGTGSTLIASACESTVETHIVVFSGSCDSLTCVAFGEYVYSGRGCQYRDRVDWDSVKGMTYLIFVYGEWEVGSFSLDLTEVSVENDRCQNATKLKLNNTVHSSTAVASLETNEFSCGGGIQDSRGPGVWYYVLGTGNPINASLCNSTFDTQIAVFSEDCDSLSCLAANDDYCSLQSAVTWPSVLNTVYYVLVQGWSPAEFGDFTLEVHEEVW